MLQKFTTLEETAERFDQSREFIWNLSLQFNDWLYPNIGENGMIAFSDEQRQIIGRILKMREQGFSDGEISHEICRPDRQKDEIEPVCNSNQVCRRNFKVLSDQVKFMWKQIRRLEAELEAMQTCRGGGMAENVERIFPAA
ncbi:MAG: hypothetical protein ACOYXC_13175 [Candidatus Rifleibacteriota bacterium]